MHKFKSRTYKNVIGLKLSGKLSREEYKDIVPYLEKKINKFGKIRLLVELDHWEGWGPYAGFNDMLFVFKHSSRIERVAFWVKSKEDRDAVLIDQPFRPWFRDTTRYFGKNEKVDAWKWVSEGVEGFQVPEEEKDEEEGAQKIRYGMKMKVLIVGGGASGTTLGALLKQRGFKPKLVEAESGEQHRDYLMSIWPSASGVLKSLGVYKKIKRAAVVAKTVKLFNEDGELLEDYNMKPVEAEYGETLWVPEHKIVEILGDKAGNIKRGVAVTNLKPVENGVKVTFSNGKQKRFDCVICSDGVDSKTRDLIFGDENKQYGGMYGWRFVINASGIDLKEASGYRTENGLLRLVPYDGKIYGFCGIKGEEPKGSDKRLGELKEHYGKIGGVVSEILSKVDEESIKWFGGFYHFEAPEWVNGRVALLGSAAMKFLPTARFGVTLSMESAYVLSDELSRSDSQFVEGSLKNYELRRKARIQFIKDLFEEKEWGVLSDPKKLAEARSIKDERTSSEGFVGFWMRFLGEPF